MARWPVLAEAHIRAREIVSLAQQWRIELTRTHIGKAVAHVQGRRMPSLAKAVECLDCQKRCFVVDLHDDRFDLVQKPLDNRKHVSNRRVGNTCKARRSLKDRQRRGTDLRRPRQPAREKGRYRSYDRETHAVATIAQAD